MIYTIFLYHSKSGLLLFDLNFQDISSGKMDLFSSFFAALKAFISELVMEGAKELKNIELGDYTVLITSIYNIEADLVIIGDKEDLKAINKIIPKIIKILLKYQNIFLEWQGKRNDFNVLDQPIKKLIFSQKKLIGSTSLIEKPEIVLKSIWGRKKELSAQQKDYLTQERQLLIDKLEISSNFMKKLAISNKLIGISENLKDDQSFIKYQEDIKFLKDEIRNTKIKLNYYLERIKTTMAKAVNSLGYKSLNEGDYKDVYLNLYSFSNKLKNMSKDNKWEIYKNMANRLINKEEIPYEDLSEAVSFILKMNENVESYLN